MTRAQQIEQQPDQQAGAPATEIHAESVGLPRPLYAQIMQLTPDDAEALSSLLTAHPGLSGPILQVAAGHMGNAAVQRAISMTRAGAKGAPGEQPAHGPLSQAELHQFLDDPSDKAPPAKAQPAHGPLSQAELHEFLDDAPARAQPGKGPLSHDEMRGFLEDPSDKAQTAGPKGPKAATPAEPPWVAAARTYNSRHSDYAAEFNELTSFKYLDAHGGGDEIDDGRKLDPKLVVSWQEQHGLQADGMVGPLTVAKAREVKARPSAVAAAPHADARPPV